MLKIEKSAIECSSSKKLLGVTVDNKLSFDCHIAYLYRKKSQKLHALSRVASYTSFDKREFFLKKLLPRNSIILY